MVKLGVEPGTTESPTRAFLRKPPVLSPQHKVPHSHGGAWNTTPAHAVLGLNPEPQDHKP